ncbi:hemicentin-2-like isoform X2 [Micropterus salmoides]|uniref:hemicentin-2-like isoform X2 n=1 Tax=Micropterus salmoides TaxID=27706 RepID=UPI0018EC0C6E|nr:hemicentin-2-like isoform X2 [Micropterus salmoides]
MITQFLFSLDKLRSDIILSVTSVCVKMSAIICSCLLAFALSCKVTAAINHEVVEEKSSVILRCPHPVEGKVTWSREINGNKVDIFTVDGDREIRHNDPGRRYSSWVDKSLHILRAAVSDAGRYFCNNEPAVDLTVLPPGTVRLTAAERTNVTLKCPPDVGGSAVPTWSRNSSVIRQKGRFNVSPVDKTLTITDLRPKDSGLYYCDGKPAAYLTVTKGNKAPPKPTSTTRPTTTTSTPATTTRQTSTPTEPRPAAATAPSTPPANTDTTKEKEAAPYLWPSVRMGIGILCLIIMISITVTTWRKSSTETENDL